MDKERFIKIGCLTRIFSLGVIVGCIGGLVWQEISAPLEITPRMNREVEIQLLQEDTNEKLLTYIEGKWTSSIGDLIIDVENSEPKGKIIVIEHADKKEASKEKIFNIVSIESVDGFFGIVKLKICVDNSQCSLNDQIPIQVNKIFGVENTVAISFDNRLAYCIRPEFLCTRAFKRTE